MALTESANRQEAVAWEAMDRCATLMGQSNAVAAQLVDVIADMLEVGAWAGEGLRSPEHWVMWRTGVSPRRAKGLVAIAQRLDELPQCMALFRSGGLSEDAMALIAAKTPAERDGELALLAPMMLHSQLRRILAHVPENRVPDREERFDRKVVFGHDETGWWGLRALLPPDEGAIVQRALESARDEIFHERQPDADPAVRGTVGWSEALVRLAEVGLDGLDPATKRGEARGERAQIIIHLDARSDGDGQARIHLGPQLPDSLRRYLCCDAKVRAAIERDDHSLLGISPLEPTVNPGTEPGAGFRPWT